MSYKLDGIDYRVKEDITKRCREILYETPEGELVSENHCAFLISLFSYHDEWQEKSSGGVKGIVTEIAEQGTKCFSLLKKSGNKIDISFPHSIKCIPSGRKKPLTPQKLLDYKAAARTAIKPQIDNFRREALQSAEKCPYTGETIHGGNCAVDHTPPDTFDKLLFDFSFEELINPLDITVASINGVVAEFESAGLAKAWEDFHEANANLRLISKTGNLQLPKVYVPWKDIIF